MAFRGIPYKKYQEIRKASKNGDPKAKNIIDKYMEDEIDYDAIERLLNDFYKVDEEEPEPECAPEESPAGEQITQEEAIDESPIPVEDNAEIEASNDEPVVEEPAVEEPKPEPKEEPKEEPAIEEPIPEEPAIEVIDLTADLDEELKDLIDEPDEDDGFEDMWAYIKDKRKNALRAKKDNAYFKAFDEGGRLKYIADKEKAYGDGQGAKRKKLDRAFRDMDNAINGYYAFIGDAPEDEIAFDANASEGAYGEIMGDDGIVSAFGRSWDEEDSRAVKQALALLVSKYGKKNVMAALNTLKSDNESFRDVSLGHLDEKAKKYGKSLESLLK